MKKWAEKFYRSTAWRKARSNYIQERYLIDGGLCEECHRQQGYIVHHKTMLTKNNIDDVNISLNPDNLEYVCRDCHEHFEGHLIGTREKKRYIFDENGDPVLPLDLK